MGAANDVLGKPRVLELLGHKDSNHTKAEMRRVMRRATAAAP